MHAMVCHPIIQMHPKSHGQVMGVYLCNIDMWGCSAPHAPRVTSPSLQDYKVMPPSHQALSHRQGRTAPGVRKSWRGCCFTHEHYLSLRSPKPQACCAFVLHLRIKSSGIGGHVRKYGFTKCRLLTLFFLIGVICRRAG